eukprot:COSAG06_NODE_7351_length_2534_cov_17.988501_5_plen_134_part_00
MERMERTVHFPLIPDLNLLHLCMIASPNFARAGEQLLLDLVPAMVVPMRFLAVLSVWFLAVLHPVSSRTGRCVAASARRRDVSIRYGARAFVPVGVACARRPRAGASLVLCVPTLAAATAQAARGGARAACSV